VSSKGGKLEELDEERRRLQRIDAVHISLKFLFSFLFDRVFNHWLFFLLPFSLCEMMILLILSYLIFCFFVFISILAEK
jgi:hypothetical protein